MKDFIMAALPWVIMGIALAVACVSFASGKKKTKNGEQGEQQMGAGVPLGMCFGVSFGAAMGALTDNMGVWLPVGISVGMLFGAAFMSTDSKKKDEDR